MTTRTTVVHRQGPLLAACALLALALSAGAAAQEEPPPPARVGQLSYIGGSVRMAVDAGAGWQPAGLNTPLVARSALATGGGARVELRIGSTAIRAGPQTQFTLAELDDAAVTVELAEGAVAMRVRAIEGGERLAVGADGVRLLALAPGAYRAEYAARQHRLTVRVLEGQARLGVAGQDLVLGAGQRAVADTQAQSVIEQAVDDERTKLDDFADQRDRRSERSAALRHLPAEMTGAEALDGYGSWRDEPGYGAVWVPDNLPPDWAPYRFGYWRWIAPWGWTWVDDAPWGFAPFHYGRWLFVAGRWAWVPGPPGLRKPVWRPVYAPALVGFYGGSDAAHWVPTPSAPPLVGWYPLAPGEVYWPAYSAHLGYVRSLNAPSVADAAQIRALPDPAAAGPAHRFARTAFAVTAVPRASFQQQQPVGQNQVAIAPADLAQAPLSGRRAPPAQLAPEPRAPAESAAAWPTPPAPQAQPAHGQAAGAARPHGAAAPKPVHPPPSRGAKNRR